MGGQACIFYGAAEFSRDTDLAILCEEDNLKLAQLALDDLCAERIAVPPFKQEYLARGHAIHFRCQHPEALGQRIDIMSVFRNMPPFPILWERRTDVQLEDDQIISLMSIRDLVTAKKTQRDKDWPMIRRLIEADYLANRAQATSEQINFWLKELKSAPLLIEACMKFAEHARLLKEQRKTLLYAIGKDVAAIEQELFIEEQLEREEDRQYWKPLRAELETLRHLERPTK